MKVFAISDLHLSLHNPKPMDIFGPAWEGYLDKIFSDWKEKVSNDDIVLLAGDFSWAMNLKNTKSDFQLLSGLPGKKVIIRGNHDYWWKSISAVRKFVPEHFYVVQNDAIKFGNIVICGSRGWSLPEKDVQPSEEDQKILAREGIRLQMSLESAKKLCTDEKDKIVCMMHFPPVNFKREDSQFSSLIKEYGVSAVVFGHLHGYKNITLKFFKDDIPYYLTSCDLTCNKLVLIEEV